eukprot:296362-Lingulodinium_polyedra.AAC.1
MAHSARDALRALMRAWVDMEVRVIVGRRTDVARIAGGIDRYGTSRVLRAGARAGCGGGPA